MKLTIKTIERKEVATPNGRTPSATKVGIQANETGNQWASCFETAYTKGWKVGDVIEVDNIEQRGKYRNIILSRAPKAGAPTAGTQPAEQPGRSAPSSNEALKALQNICGFAELSVKILQRMELKLDKIMANQQNGQSTEEFKTGDDVSQPSGGSTEDREPPENDSNSPKLPF